MATASIRGLVQSQYDVLEYYGGEAWLAVSILRRLPRRRFLLVCHSNGLETHCAEDLRAAGGQRGPRRWYQTGDSFLFSRTFQGVDALVTVSDYDRDYALRKGYLRPDRVLAIENPLPGAFLGLALSFARNPIIGYCGSWLPRKGSRLIQADLPMVLREFPEWRLTLVGVGPDFRPEEHFPLDILSRITVVPQADRETSLRELYQTFAISIVPSIYESFGMAAAESMACGCALVATNVGFAATLRHGEEAFLLRERASPSLYHSLRALIENQALRERIARAGYQRAQSLRWENAVGALESAYLSWLDLLRKRHSRGEG
jgi:glycosyltransferase involved in cell wall biosynthesis